MITFRICDVSLWKRNRTITSRQFRCKFTSMDTQTREFKEKKLLQTRWSIVMSGFLCLASCFRFISLVLRSRCVQLVRSLWKYQINTTKKKGLKQQRSRVMPGATWWARDARRHWRQKIWEERTWTVLGSGDSANVLRSGGQMTMHTLVAELSSRNFCIKLSLQFLLLFSDWFWV